MSDLPTVTIESRFHIAFDPDCRLFLVLHPKGTDKAPLIAHGAEADVKHSYPRCTHVPVEIENVAGSELCARAEKAKAEFERTMQRGDELVSEYRQIVADVEQRWPSLPQKRTASEAVHELASKAVRELAGDEGATSE